MVLASITPADSPLTASLIAGAAIPRARLAMGQALSTGYPLCQSIVGRRLITCAHAHGGITLRQLYRPRCVSVTDGRGLSGGVVTPAIRYSCIRAPTVVRVFSGRESVPGNPAQHESRLTAGRGPIRAASPAI